MLLESQFEQVVLDMESLEPKERVSTWLKLAEYVLPKLTRSEVVVEPEEKEPDTFSLDLLTVDEMALLLDLMNKGQGAEPSERYTFTVKDGQIVREYGNLKAPPVGY